MKKKLLSLIGLTLVSLMIFALPTMADTKPAAPDTHTEADMKDMSDDEMSGHSEGEAAPEVIVATEGKFQVIVQSDPVKPAPKKPVNIMITVKNEATGEPVLDASVNVEMMLMEAGAHGSMAGMDSSPETLKGQAKLDNMEPGMYSVTLTPTKQGEWTQDVHISSPTLGETTVTVPLTVTKTGPNWILIGSVGGVVVLAGIVAQILKRKQSASKEV
ncbi:FixH family protein [Desulfosporosinus lacus]|uniref:YtkA-like n=1 Tax=Desulfosporosinus lacus DSM 15449 TaxID=1121420 RepID=A0A1M5QTE6_9FIRM|nr:FixH family protein [Desulfosporosinus lacus]SHH17238.1 YtkA-like [Desulfosporosinus lacus DSM 15449]